MQLFFSFAPIPFRKPDIQKSVDTIIIVRQIVINGFGFGGRIVTISDYNYFHADK